MKPRLWRLAGVIAALTLLFPAAPAFAQQVASQAVLDRVAIVEGRTRTFQISNVTPRPRYHVHASVGGAFTAEAGDVTITTDDLRGEAQAITPDAAAPRAYRDTTYGTVNFEVTANADSDGAGDETFGVRLCTTADCAGGTVLGEWTVSVTEPAADTTLSGTGATVTIPGGSAVSVMEVSRNRDGRDRRATFSIDLTSAPTSDIAVVAYTETGAATGAATMRPFARINSALSPDYPPHGDDNHNTVQAEYLVGYWASGATGAQEFTVISTDNTADTPGGTIAGALKFKVYEDNEAFRTTLSGSSTDTTYGNATAYSGIAIPDLPVRVTDDDEPTRVRLLPASPADNEATEGNTDKATVLVKLDRALVADEEVTALLTFGGATLGTHFTLAAASGQTGVTYADSGDGTQGLVTLAGAGAQEGVIEVTALADSDSDSQTLQIGMPPTDQPWQTNHHRSNLDGGVCAAHGCPDRPQGDPGQRFQSVTLTEAVPGLTVIENEDPDLRQVTEGGDYSYDIRLNTAPSNDVTVTVTIASGGTVTTATLTFTPSNYDEPQTVTVRADGNDDDGPRGTVTVTHAFSGDSAYAGLPDATHEVTVLDDDPTTITMAGAGVRPGGNGNAISRIMVEGDPLRVDRTLTLTLGRALEAGEYIRVPLRIEAVANGNDPSLPDDPPDQGDGDPDLPGDLDPRRTTVDSHRGPRASANVAWPPHHNDFVMTATGTGVSYEHSNRHTPNHIGFRYIEFRGAGARTATIVLHARDGFDDGETHDEAFAITFPNDFYVFDADTDQPFNSSPVEGNLGGGVQAMPAGAEAWFGITDKGVEGVDPSLGQVPADWPLLPPGLQGGDQFRLIYVTNGKSSVELNGQSGRTRYTNFVRAEITGNQLKAGGVDDLKPYAELFQALITVDFGGGAEVAAKFQEGNASHPEGPIYWVKGNKVADSKADFRDGSWDDETNPKFADGTDATIDSDGYWTGSKQHGGRRGGTNCPSGGDHLNAGKARVNVGYLNNSNADLTPLGPTTDTCDYGMPNSETRPMYAMTDRLLVVTDGASIESAEAAEGSPVTFTVTIPEAAPAGGITVPYTLSDGRGFSADPAHIVATGASGGTGADYDNDAGTVVIAQGATTVTFTVNTTNDSTYEGDHYFTVTLGTPTGTNAPGLHPNKDSATGIITDDDDQPTFQFGAATATVTEGTDTQVSFTVTKTGTTAVASSVYWTTADGTASHPGDYTANAGHLRFAPGDTSRTVTIDLVDDGDGENAETFKVQLGQPNEATLGGNDEATVTLNDDDGGVTSDVLVTWSQANDDPLPPASDLLIEGQTYTIKVSLAAAPSADVAIPIGVGFRHPRAMAGDYSVPASVTIPGGSTSASFVFTAEADDLLEGPEFVELILCPAASCPDGYTSGDAPPTFQVLFRDPGVVTDLSGLPNPTGVPGEVGLDEGASGTFTVRPEIDPVQAATISFKAVAGSEAGVDGVIAGTATAHIAFDTDPDMAGFQNALTFTGGDAGNWGTPRTVAIHALYDGDAGSDDEYSVGILNSASGGPYMSQVNTGAPTRINVEDAGHAVVVNPVTVTVAANGTVTYAMQLASDPGGTVRVDPTSGDAGKATVSGQNKTFDSSNWHTPQQVTVTGVGVGTATITHAVVIATAAYPNSTLIPSVDVTVTAAAGVDVTLSASDGDANGNAVEGASGVTGYRTVTLTLGRALTGSETITVPLTVQGATVTTDYTFGLQPTTQNGVTLLTSGGSNSAQNPAVRFAAGATTAMLRFTPVDNDARSQPAISIGAGTPAATGGVTLGNVTGAPIVFSIVDDETGAVVVPANWALKPAGLGGGDTFRLIFITSETRTAESADIDDYNRWVRGVVGRGGHANLLPYGGLVTVIGTTAAVEARENTGIWDPSLNSGSGGYTDGSASASDSGMKIYWLAAPPAHRVADSYFEFHDDAGWEGGTDQSGADTLESGASRTSSSVYWTGSYPNGTKLGSNDSVLGTTQSTTVVVGAADTAGFNSISDAAAFTKTNSLPMMGISPVFEVEAPELSFDMNGAFSGDEGDPVTVTVISSIAAPAAATVSYTVTGGTAISGTDYTALSGTFTLTAGAASHAFTINTMEDTLVEGNEDITIRLDAGTGYSVGSPDTATVTITDDDTAVATPEISMALQTGEGSSRNGAGQLELNESGGVDGAVFNLSADAMLASTLTVCLRVAETGGDLLAASAEGIRTATLTSAGNANGAGIHQLTWTGDADDERDSVVTATLLAPGTAGCSAANGSYTVSSAMASDAVRIEDDDATTVELTSADRGMAEGDASDTAALTFTLGRRLYADEAVVVPFTLATSTGARLPGHATPDFSVTASGAGVTVARANTATPSLTFAGHDTNVVQTATVTLTPVSGRDDGDMDHEALTATLASDSVLGSTSGSGTTVGGGAARHGTNFAANLRLADDEAPPAGVTFSATPLRLLENGSEEYTVVLDQEPTADVTLTITGAGAHPSAATASPGTLTFTPSGSGIWSSPQTVTVTGMDEPGARRNRALTLRHAATSSDSGYSGDYDLPAEVDDAPEVEAWEGWERADGSRGENVALFRPNTVSSTPGIWPRQDMVFGGRPQDYVIRLSNRPEPGGTVTVNVGRNNADVQLGLTRTGPWSSSLTVTFGDGFAQGAAAPNMAACNNSHDYTKGGEAHDGTAATSWECWRKVWLRRVGDGHHCTDITHTASGGGVRSRTIETIRVHNPTSVRNNNHSTVCAFLTPKVEPRNALAMAPDVQVPDSQVSNVRVTAVDAASAKVTWDAVEHATSYEVEYETTSALTDTGNHVQGVAFDLKQTSFTFRHDAAEAMTLTVTVTPAYEDGNGDTQLLSSLAGTATIDVGPSGTGNGDSISNGGSADDVDAGTGTTPQQPDYSELKATVRGYADETEHGDDHVNRWMRALAALGDEDAIAAGHAPMTAAEAQDMADTYSADRWDPVVEALTELESREAEPEPDPIPELSLSGGGGVDEGGSASFTIHADPAPAADVAVGVAVAQSGDYLDAPGAGARTVTLAAGAATASVAIATVNDSTDEPDGSVSVSLNAGTGYTVASSSAAATVAVRDDDEPVPEVSVSAGGDVAEGAAASFTITASPAPASALDVDVTVDQNGDFAASGATGSRTVTIPSSGSATLTVATEDDGADEADGSVRVRIDAGAGYTVASSPNHAATVAVRDNDDPPPAASCVTDSDWDTVAGYYDSNANRSPNYGANWYRVLIAYRSERADRPLPDWEGATAAPTAAFTAADAEDEEAVWSGWAPVREVLECLEKPGTQSFVPLLPAASNPAREGVVRIANPGTRGGAVRIAATDDAGWRPEPILLRLGRGQSVLLTSADLESGNASKGLSAGIGTGTGDWRLTVSGDAAIQVQPHIRSADGRLAAMDAVAPVQDGAHQVAMLQPADDAQHTGLLRLVNRGSQALTVRITALDDSAAPGGAVSLKLPARAAATFTVSELERGGSSGLDGALGDGNGLWRLRVASTGELAVMALAEEPGGHLENLSDPAPAARLESGVHAVAGFPSAYGPAGRPGMLRIVNGSAAGGTVAIRPYDAEGRALSPVRLRLDAGEAVNLNAWDLEFGNPAKGLSGGAGPAPGDWRIEVESGLDLRVLPLIETRAANFARPADAQR